jgi:hypothetical protein
MLDNIFSYSTYKGEFRALYSKLTFKIEVIVALKVYYIGRSSIGLGGPAFN